MGGVTAGVLLLVMAVVVMLIVVFLAKRRSKANYLNFRYIANSIEIRDSIQNFLHGRVVNLIGVYES